MPTSESVPGGEELPGNLGPSSSSQPAVNVTKQALREKNQKGPSPTDRLEARADRHIDDLQKDKHDLQAELERLRTREIAHLRDDVRWLEDLASRQSQTLARLKTSFEYAITFSWLSSALVTLGGAAISLAALLPLPIGPQRVMAIAGFVGLLIGVVVQAVNSYRGSRVSQENPSPSPFSGRPDPNPVRTSRSEREQAELV